MNQLKQIWEDVYNPELDTRIVIEQHFHPDYSQCINGVVLNRDDYINHVIAQKNNMVVEHFEYAQHMQNGDEMFAIYYPRGRALDGSEVEGEVVSYIKFKDNQILEIHGQVRLTKGHPSVADMDE